MSLQVLSPKGLSIVDYAGEGTETLPQRRNAMGINVDGLTLGIFMRVVV